VGIAMLLKQGDSGDGVRALQRGLNKLGSILLVDGGFGPGTRDAVIDGRTALGQPGPPEADDALQQSLATLPDPFPPLTPAGVTFIARAEVSGPREYRSKYSNPVWPGGQSGITIGIGYDLAFVNPDRFNADWGDHLPPEAIARLSDVLRKQGTTDLRDQVRDVEVPLLAAVSVFLRRSLPDYLKQTRSIYPQVDDLPPARRSALVSLVYNRGTRLQDKDPRQDRLEMRKIRDLLAEARSDDVAEQLDAMSRLWDPAKQSGLIRRRHDEATLWRSGFAALQLD
jgi:peptidoglycan hydrolase-like protein with peptidoglycan-binding domain